MDGQQVHEKIFNIISHQGNANQNHNEISPHICENGYYKKIASVGKDMEKREPLGTVGGNVNWLSHYGKLQEDSSEN